MLKSHQIELFSARRNLQAAAENAAEAASADLVLVPTDRHHREKVQAGWPVHRVFTFPNFLHALNRTKPMDLMPEAHQRMVLAHLVRELSQRKKLKAFGPLAEQPGFLSALFTELSDLSGLGVEPTVFSAAIRQMSARPHPKDADVALIYQTYRSILAKHQWRDRTVEYADALANWPATFAQSFPDCKSISVEDFVEFSPPQRTLLEKLAQLGIELHIRMPMADDPGREELWQVAEHSATLLVGIVPERQNVESTFETKLSAGLEYTRHNLFRSDVSLSHDATGLRLIESPGLVGEVKLVLRQIKTFMLNGVAAGDIMITMRDLSPYADLLQEFSAEYGIPIDVESTSPLSRIPVVAALLKAAGLFETDWPFTGTGALLRSSYLKPNWPELEADPEIALDTELLLRWLGEPRGRGAYLQTATIKARNLDPPLEDETAANSHRQYVQKLAERCLPFLTRFLGVWDTAPAEATLQEHIAWLQSLADELGFSRTATGRDVEGLHRFFAELHTWSQRDRQLHARPPLLMAAEFLRRAEWIANANRLPQDSTEPTGVRIVPAELAAGLSYQHLFLMGMSEGSFPNLGAGPRIYDEKERQEFHGVGIEFDVCESRRSSEMLLFFRLLTGASQSITLSYPAVDEQGQALLPATFLQDVKDLFAIDAIPTARREMLIEGIDSDPPMSPTEYRWRYALAGGSAGLLPPGLVDQLRIAQSMAQNRFTTQEFGAYDGILRDVAALRDLDERFGPRATFSATALESYVACPFKYFVGQGLQLQQLPVPGEEIEARLRGAAYHRAVARLHRDQQLPNQATADQLVNRLEEAVAEYARRAGSPITKTLWKLEYDRLGRQSQKYGEQWSAFRSKSDQAVPAELEVDFGPNKANEALIIRRDKLEIRISGRIDRIDIVDHDDDHGYWIIDYKTGSAGNYTGPAVDRFDALQLPLYAWAAHHGIAPLQSRRPMGIAYWFPTTGHKIIKQWREPEAWESLRDRLEKALCVIVSHIRMGAFPLQPRDRDNCTSTCDFGQMCRIAQSRSVVKNWTLPLPTVEAPGDE